MRLNYNNWTFHHGKSFVCVHMSMCVFATQRECNFFQHQIAILRILWNTTLIFGLCNILILFLNYNVIKLIFLSILRPYSFIKVKSFGWRPHYIQITISMERKFFLPFIKTHTFQLLLKKNTNKTYFQSIVWIALKTERKKRYRVRMWISHK